MSEKSQGPQPDSPEPGTPEWLARFDDLETTPAQEQGIHPLSLEAEAETGENGDTPEAE
jgi:hypothetical protein